MSVAVPGGFRMAGVACGIKASQKLDVSLIVSESPAAAAGVYTQNLVFAAPVVLDRKRTPGDQIRAVVINSGNANACTGERGDRDAQQMAVLAAEACGARSPSRCWCCRPGSSANSCRWKKSPPAFTTRPDGWTATRLRSFRPLPECLPPTPRTSWPAVN